MHKPIIANVISFDQGPFLLTQTYSSSCSSSGKETEERPAQPHLQQTVCIAIPFKFLQFSSLRRATSRPRIISRENFPKRTHILPIPSEPYSGHSVHSAIWSRMDRIAFHHSENGIGPKRTRIPVYSVYSYSGIVPKERAPNYIVLI